MKLTKRDAAIAAMEAQGASEIERLDIAISVQLDVVEGALGACRVAEHHLACVRQTLGTLQGKREGFEDLWADIMAMSIEAIYPAGSCPECGVLRGCDHPPW